MTYFLKESFLLETKFAEELYHDFAKNQPIIDYHNHLPANEIAENINYRNLTHIWLDGDHYKWRAMRNFGIEEKYITGNATNEMKFKKWAEIVPYTLRNPLFHWTHLELKRYFDRDIYLNKDSADEIYHSVSEQLQQPEYTTQSLLSKMNVEMLCTTDDPIDDLEHHKRILESENNLTVLPTFRPDGILNIEDSQFINYIDKLAQKSDLEILSLSALLEATQARINYFHNIGCRLSDHGLPYVYGEDFTIEDVNSIFKKRLAGKSLSANEIVKYKSGILVNLGEFYAEKNWTMQLHIGPIRDVNDIAHQRIGSNIGTDSIGDFKHVESLASFLNKLNNNGNLPKTIIYNSNSSDNDAFATMSSNFFDEGIKAKVQFGAAWWFLDQKEGIEKQIKSLSSFGILANSIGMLTDSRSFLSFPRHEYFRRILCNIFGNDIQKGLLPNDMNWVGGIINDICYNNVKSYLNLPVEAKVKL